MKDKSELDAWVPEIEGNFVYSNLALTEDDCWLKLMMAKNLNPSLWVEVRMLLIKCGYSVIKVKVKKFHD